MIRGYTGPSILVAIIFIVIIIFAIVKWHNAPSPQISQQGISDISTRFEQVAEEIQQFPPAIFPINNCGGSADVRQEITHSYVHEVVDETQLKLGLEIPGADWLKIVAEIEKHYGTSDKETITYSTILTVPAGQKIQYTLVREQTWESGIIIVDSDGKKTSAAYRILKNETFEVANSEQKPCP